MSIAKRITLIIVIIGFFCLQYPLHKLLISKRREEGFIDRILYKPADIINITVLAGFKGIAANILWGRIDEYSSRGQMYKMLPIFEMVTYLQPHFVLAWSIGGWHMAFNIYHEAKTEKEKQRWLNAGLNYLKRGISYNPQDYTLYFDVGWTHWMKSKNYKECIKYFKMASMVDHPQWVEHMLAHSYAKDGQLEKAYEVWKNIKERGSEPGLRKVVDKFVGRLGKKLGKKDT